MVVVDRLNNFAHFIALTYPYSTADYEGYRSLDPLITNKIYISRHVLSLEQTVLYTSWSQVFHAL